MRDLAARVELVAEQTELAVAAWGDVVAPGPVRPATGRLRSSPERFALQITIGEATRSKLVPGC